MARAQHSAKAAPDSESQSIACLLGMLESLHREHTAAAHAPERAGHLADAIRDLETIIARARILPLARTRMMASGEATLIAYLKYPGDYVVVDSATREIIYEPFHSNPDPQIVAGAVAQQLQCLVLLEPKH